MKYVDTKVTFSEVPDEIILSINISECPFRCKGCHSEYLREDIGFPLNVSSLGNLLRDNPGITCVAFLGGDADPATINILAHHAKNLGVKTCWYSGREDIPRDAIDTKNFDYIKIGPYIEELGGLDSPTTNQRMFQNVENKVLVDITYKLKKQ